MTSMGAIPATAAENPAASIISKKQTALKYSTTDVISFFVLSSGSIFNSNPELAERLGLEHQDVPSETVDELVALFEEIDPHLTARVVEPVQSGNPLRAQAGIKALGEDVKLVNTRLMGEQAANRVSTGRASANGWLWTQSYVATVQIAAAAGYVLALGAAVVAGVFVLLYEPNTGATKFDRELAARAISGAL
ncbi:hypothetical protein [Cryobacterium sp. PH31-L1]|uniref:hypothetical protein n=1 Tax=Cryobacterium sp. PH31-L1 TaxID=3046199 RepID=UPI0024BB02C5|nr:hypothetical protein [Cryobacterium sp. PH31-L1]MDJ0376262.1 hypothetical protein [Cryobacterium sp. PH31-L1]